MSHTPKTPISLITARACSVSRNEIRHFCKCLIYILQDLVIFVITEINTKNKQTPQYSEKLAIF